MAQEIADSTLLDSWASSGNIVEPDVSKIIEGWQFGEQPPHEYMNWLQNTLGSKLNHILKNGIAKWNNETEYLAGSSVQHNGNVWLCKTTNTNSEPTDSNKNWDKIPSLENLALTVNTINDFPTSATTGDTCIVKDLNRGGIFVYDSTKVSEDNQGTNFNGWVRQYSGAVNVKWFGAVTGQNNREYIQNAVSIGGVIQFDELYEVSFDSSTPSVSGAYGNGAICINLSKGVKLIGNGGLKLIDGANKTEGAIIGNAYITAISEEITIDIEINGNSDNTSGTVSGILLVGCDRVVINDKTYIHDITNHGIMCRPNPSQSGMTDTVMIVNYPRVENCGNIGIQGTRVKEFIHNGSYVKNCGDNCIDVYGNNPSASGYDEGFVGKAIINNPFVENGNAGVFIESFSDWSINNYDIRSCKSGIFLNRINSGALQGQLKGGLIKGDTNADVTDNIVGVKVKNSSGFISIANTRFESLSSSLSIIGGSGAERIYMDSSNTHKDIREYIVDYPYGTSTFVKSTIKDQYMYNETRSYGFPQMTKPIDHIDYDASLYKVSIGSLRSISGDTEFLNDFELGTFVLSAPSAWGGSTYSLYNINNDGETRVNTSPDTTTLDLLPSYAVINGNTYNFISSGTSGEYWVRLFDGEKSIKGDYRTSLNSALTGSLKFDSFVGANKDFFILDTITGWLGAYSVYNHSSDGKTRITTKKDITINTFVLINGREYYLTDTGVANEYYVALWNGATYSDGNYTSYINGEYRVWY